MKKLLISFFAVMLVFGNAPLAVAQNNLPALPTLPEMPSLPPIPSLPAMPELFAPDTLIVKFAENSSTEIKNQTNSQLGGRFFKDLPELDLQIIKVPFGQMEVYMQAYNQNPNVLYAEPDYVATAYGISNDPSLPSQWGLYKIDAAEAGGQSAWDITYGSASVKIAVLDTGIEESHPDLAGKIVGRANFSASASNSDFFGHGTHVAGIAAAATNNGTGIAGAGYNTSLMNIKVLDDNGNGYYSSIINGIKYAADNGADVINLSLGGPSGSQAMQDAINYAWNRGVVVVAAAGNDGRNRPSYPAYYSNAIAVAATDSNDSRASWSNYGSAWVDVAAPGVSIYSTYKNGSYSNLSGTSMATPFVAGLAGLIFGSGQCAIDNNACVRNKIESTADKISGTGSLWSKGRINAFKALGGAVVAAPVSYALSVSKTGSGSGNITSSPAGINCGSDCNENFASGTQVNLIATADANSTFAGWNGACAGMGATCVLTMDAAKSVSVVFNLSEPPPVQQSVYVADILMWQQNVSFFYKDVYTKVVIKDTAGNLVSGATVSLSLQPPFGGAATGSAPTGADGSVTFRYRTIFGGVYVSTVTNVTKSGLIYNASQNVKNSASLLVN